MTIPNDLDGFLAGYDAGKAAALEWAAGQVEAEIDEAADERRGGVSEKTFKLRRLAAKIREGTS